MFSISTVCSLFLFQEVSVFRYFYFCWNIGISFFGLIFSNLFSRYVLFLTLLSFICFVSDFCWKYFSISWSIGISFFGLIFYSNFISRYVLFLTLLKYWYFLSILLFNICFLLFVLFPISTVLELFFSEKVSCFRLWDIFISAEVLVLAFWSDLSNLLLNMFCFWHCFLSFLLFPISTVLELFFSEETILFQIMRYFHFCWSIGISFFGLIFLFYC